jgi:hypothetical protein
MTHDELLAKIYDSTNGLKHKDIFILLIENTNALRAAVELHQPTPEGRYPNLLCQGCSMTEVNLYANYPCPTIQAIEKELS